LSLYDHTILLTRLSSCFGFQFHGTVISCFFSSYLTSHHSPSVLNVAALSLFFTNFLIWRSTRLCSRSSSFHNVQHSSARNLGFIFYEHLSFSDQISALSKSGYFLIRALRCIRPYLDQKKQPVPSPHPLSILNLTTATLFIIIFLTPNYTDSI